MNSKHKFTVIVRYLVKGVSPLTYKIRNIPRFIDLYTLHQNKQQTLYKLKLKDYEEQNQYVSPNQNVMNILRRNIISNKQSISWHQLKLSAGNKYQNLSTKLFKDKNYEDESKNLMSRFFQFLSLYYESLQNMIQGKREVLHNQNFKFQDEETAKQKTDKFQKIMSGFMGKISQSKKK